LTTKDVIYFIVLFLSVAFFIIKSPLFNRNKYVSKKGFLLLFFISIVISAAYSFASIHFFKADVLIFFRDANNISCYLEQDFSKNIELLFWYGGKIDPPRVHNQIMGTNTWSIPSDFLMSRIYGFFMYLSRENLYVISFFFGLMSFATKYMWIQLFEKYNLSKSQVYLGIMALTFSGIDSFFIQGMHKEAVVFLLISYVFYFNILEKNLLSIWLLLITLIHIAMIRNYIFAIFLLVYLIWILQKMYSKNKKVFYYLLFTLSIGSIFILKKIIPFLISRKLSFNKKAIGKTALEYIDFNNSFIENLTIFFKSLFKLFFYIPNISNFSFLHTFFILSNLFFILWIIYFFKNKQIKNVNIAFFTFLPSIIGLLLIIIIVPNYGSIARYRSVFIILIYLGIVFNTNRVNIFSMYNFSTHFIKKHLFLHHKK
jgi:hypothetical protein